MSVKKILGTEELMEIAGFLIDKGYDTPNLSIVITLPDKKTLNRVNDDFFYRNNDGKEGETETVDEVNINIGSVHFKYVAQPEENAENS